jgi:hypothetical protein
MGVLFFWQQSPRRRAGRCQPRQTHWGGGQLHYSRFHAEKQIWSVYRSFAAFMAVRTDKPVAKPSTKIGMPFASMVNAAPLVT